MTESAFLSEYIARTIAQAYKAEWYPLTDPFAEGWGEFVLVRGDEVKAFLRVLPDSNPDDFELDHFLDFRDTHRASTTLRSLGLKLLVARRAPKAIQIATVDGVSITSFHLHPDRVRLGWTIDAVEFRRSVPLPDGKDWSDLRHAKEG